MQKQIKLVILDVDGALTDGKVYYSSSGELIKPFCVKDGFFLKHVCPALGIKFAIISGGYGEIVYKRAEVLGITDVFVGNVNKAGAYAEIKQSYSLSDDEIAYFGDDWFDWSAMKYAGLKGAPSDAAPEIKERADFVTASKAGNGAVREFLEFILKRDDKFEEAKKTYLD
ncbi:MAG TPA: HAD hydrolase family protein [Clostridiales bacterium]|mgnify:CR=1 FL=1|jgi:3-deoxy-D-manno-octulosonate 8-phosphate phosphatase (KDO 8-P phosphatase)|nr:HAD hydrolase family protein [Clostridiales bacterium]HQP69633.1 HAD hydrolase family protein [Clostridiales bacterium]